MKQVYEVYTQNGVIVVDEVPDLTGEPWYRVRTHDCYHNEQLPCQPWVVHAEFGDVPELEAIT